MAVRIALVVCVCAGICIGVPMPSKDPLCGLKMRITSECLNYANTVLIDNLKTKVVGSKIDDINNVDGHLTFQLTTIYVKELSIPSSSVVLQDNKIKWSARDVSIAVSADYNYHYINKIAFVPIKISDHGGVDLTVTGASFDVMMEMGIDGTKRPRVHTSSCFCDIEHVKIKFSGGSIGTLIYNLFVGLIESYMKDVLQKFLCNSINDVINVRTEKSLGRVQISTHIGKQFRLDYGLLKPPVFHTGFMETFHTGTIYWRNKNESVHFSPSQFPPIIRSGKMVYIWVSGYMFNSLTYQAQRHGMLQKTITNDDFVNSTSGLLNTSCKFGGICIGKILPQLRTQFPNEVVEIELASNKAPNIGLIDEELHLTMNGRMTMYVRPPTAPASGRQYLFTMDTNMTSVIKVTYADGYLHSKLGKMRFNICISNSTLHPLYEKSLNFIMQNIVKQYIQPVLDDQGAIGLPLIKSNDLKLTNTDIHLVQDAIIIGTDLEILKI